MQNFYCSPSNQTDHDHNQELSEIMFDSGQALVRNDCQFGLSSIYKRSYKRKMRYKMFAIIPKILSGTIIQSSWNYFLIQVKHLYEIMANLDSRVLIRDLIQRKDVLQNCLLHYLKQVLQ